MSRKIKFRSWLKDKEIMLYDFTSMINDVESDDELRTLMQYTGIKDRNGREIYEGDIIGVINNTFKAEIIYEAPSFKLRWIDKFHTKRDADNKTIAWNAHIIYEVIGNVYENPKMLSK